MATISAVVEVCERCGDRSRPLDPADAESYRVRHAAQHEGQDRYDRMKEQGHAVKYMTTVWEPDDMQGYVQCECGWRSREAKTCWLNDYVDEHLIEVESSVDGKDLTDG